MSRKVVFIVAILAVLGGGVYALTRVIEQRTKAAKIESEILHGLSQEDVILLLENQQLVDPSKTASVVATAESRQAFLKGLREYLSLAARARREGVTEDANVKATLEYKEDGLLSSLYLNKLDNDQGSFYQISKEQFEAFWADAANQSRFDLEMGAIKAIQIKVAESTGNPFASPVLEGEAKEKNRENWAKMKIVAAIARADEAFINQRAVQLRLKVAEAGTLSASYLNKHWAEKIRVTDREIAEFLGTHPEYDVAAKRERSRAVLGRVLAGEDIAALAKEFSEDRSTKSSAGLYQDMDKGLLWPEVEKAAMALEKGQIAHNLVETKDGFHIVQLVDKKAAKDEDGNDTLKLSIRHILFQRRFEEPGNKNPDVPPPFLTPQEIAEAAVRISKRQQFVDGIVATEQVQLPDDFPFEMTEELKNSGMRIENMIDQIEAEEKEARKQQQKTK